MIERSGESIEGSFPDDDFAQPPTFGYLDELVSDPAVTDIAVTGQGDVWIDRGAGMEEVLLRPGFAGPRAVRDFAVQLCAQLGRRLDDARPMADASSREGIRVHAVLAPLVPEGAAISIRLPNRNPPGLEKLVAGGLCPVSWLFILRALVVNRATILVTGGTGAGKTTLLRALLGMCPQEQRLVVVEEVRELGRIAGHRNLVSLAARESNIEGAGGVGLVDLVKATLRMRPDRIILGECRGEEIADLLRAFNSGHRGGMATLHADNVERVPARLAALGLLAGLEPRALAALAQGAFDVVIHLERTGGHRHIAQIGRLTTTVDGRLLGEAVCTWPGRGAATYGTAWSKFARRWGIVTSASANAA
ncbi:MULTISPECIES: CpaF family protein [Bifidobacterium]|uniref:Pilus assembly protein n=1 Tax=Bifidobacterium asteroides TaxID=1684 RepID=A0A556RA16_9BIFI|nr:MULTISPECIES: ATPase, T2SS/T4P/T4SS family [Bifidobacterium]MBI0086550.1 Flp pilus assembly complex ATPase component TadA [Bifidobacterium sp. M0404]TSJ85738.1 pilus assembly protein [Bifidobacterium polysaccharolyticum]